MATLRVLIVDDEPGIRSGVKRILSGHRVDFPFLDEDFTFELSEAASGEEALDIIRKQAVDIVLLDNKLPGIHGIEVLEIIKKEKFDISVMMITSYASLDLAVKATNNGAYNFVPKPFTPQELKNSIESITKHLYLKRMTRKLNEEGRQIRFQFLSVLSHELKSPINAIEGYLRIMQEKQVGENIGSYEIMINRSLERIKGMRTLIMDMLDLTRLENGKKNRQITKTDLVQIARIAGDSMSPMAIQKNVKIFIDSNEPHVYMMACTDEMEIIFNNLVSNAVKYNREGGEVYCNIYRSEQLVIITVKDTGIGMSPDEKAMLFQEFMRIKNEKTKAISGSGLGLSIVKKIVEEVYKGSITVESEPDKGSTFRVELPVGSTQGLARPNE